MADEINQTESEKTSPFSASEMFPKISKSIDEGMNPKKSKSSLFYWKLAQEDLEEQVVNYESFSLKKSYRGQMLLIYILLLSLTLIIGFFNIAGYDMVSSIAQVIIYAPFLFFAYLGHRRAMILLVILETINRVLLLGNGTSGVMVIVWWALLVSMIYKAYQVEVERDKRLKSQTQSPPLIS